MPTLRRQPLLKRDRVIVFASLAAVTVIAWVNLLRFRSEMHRAGIVLQYLPEISTMHSSTKPWTAGDFAFTFAMWAVMMVGMMIPSASPAIIWYAQIAQHAIQHGKVLAAAGWFAAGYVLSWTVFSMAATFVQAGLAMFALITPMLVASTNRIGGVILIGAGLYELTPLKRACLNHCRLPLEFLRAPGGMETTAMGSMRTGFQHGLYCIGCCWALMALLFAGGVMNLSWIAAIAGLILVEKVLPGGNPSRALRESASSLPEYG